MEKNIEVIGVTNMPKSVASLLNVKDETEYGLYQETAMGKYYAKRLPDGTLDATKVVRLISDEQAAEMEAKLCAMITGESEKFSELAKGLPVVCPEKMNAGIYKITDEIAEGLKMTIGKSALLEFRK